MIFTLSCLKVGGKATKQKSTKFKYINHIINYILCYIEVYSRVKGLKGCIILDLPKHHVIILKGLILNAGSYKKRVNVILNFKFRFLPFVYIFMSACVVV